MFVKNITVSVNRDEILKDVKTTEVSAVNEQVSEKKFYKPMVDFIWDFLAENANAHSDS